MSERLYGGASLATVRQSPRAFVGLDTVEDLAAHLDEALVALSWRPIAPGSLPDQSQTAGRFVLCKLKTSP